MPDFPPDKPPDYRAAPDAKGMDAIDGNSPFIMHSDGKGWLFAPGGIKDGPLPTHYEPVESPIDNPLYKQRINPTADHSRDRLSTPSTPPEATPQYPGGRDHVPADRALPERRHEPLR